jgi:hypothetical protein
VLLKSDLHVLQAGLRVKKSWSLAGALGASKSMTMIAMNILNFVVLRKSDLHFLQAGHRVRFVEQKLELSCSLRCCLVHKNDPYARN